MTILMDHYKEGLDQALQELEELLIPNWRAASKISVRWARRSLQRLTRDAIDHPEALITARMVATEGQEVQPRTSRPAPERPRLSRPATEQPRPSRLETVTTAVQTSPEESRRLVRFQGEPSTTHSSRPPDEARPAVRSRTVQATSTPYSEEEDEEREPPSYQVPCQQRPVRRRARAVFLEEEDLSLEREEPALINFIPLEEAPMTDSPQESMRYLFTLDKVRVDLEEEFSSVRDSNLDLSPLFASRSPNQGTSSLVQHEGNHLAQLPDGLQPGEVPAEKTHQHPAEAH